MLALRPFGIFGGLLDATHDGDEQPPTSPLASSPVLIWNTPTYPVISSERPGPFGGCFGLYATSH